jgi:hypothetical protein
MTIVVASPTPGPFDQNLLRPNAAFFADYTTGTIDAFTGQAATFTRSGTQSIVASQGTYTIGANQPRLEWVQGELGYVPTGSTLSYGFNSRTTFPTRIHATVIRTSDTSGVIARIGATASALGTLTLEQNSERYRLVYTTDANDVSSIEVTPTLPLDTRIDLIATADLSNANKVIATLSWRTTGAYSFAQASADAPTITAWSAAEIHVGSLAGSSVPGSTIRALLVTYNSGPLRPWGWA